MSAISWVRNTMIFAGIGVGALIVVHAAVKRPPEVTLEQAAPQVAVILNTARLSPLAIVKLGKPLSLESAFGRSEITGRQVFRVPVDPLFELDIIREYDTTIGRMPPLPAIEMQPRRAEDEVSPGENGPDAPAANVTENELADLPAAARESAESGRKELNAGNDLMHDGLAILRGDKRGDSLDDVDKKLSAARRHFEAARDQFREALAFAPEHYALLGLMQETKANLYTCSKHGRKR